MTHGNGCVLSTVSQASQRQPHAGLCPLGAALSALASSQFVSSPSCCPPPIRLACPRGSGTQLQCLRGTSEKARTGELPGVAQRGCRAVSARATRGACSEAFGVLEGPAANLWGSCVAQGRGVVPMAAHERIEQATQYTVTMLVLGEPSGPRHGAAPQ